jgi:hypothetical protein
MVVGVVVFQCRSVGRLGAEDVTLTEKGPAVPQYPP